MDISMDGSNSNSSSIEGDLNKRISPLRGLDSEDVVSYTRVVRNGLTSLRDDHYSILARIRKECDSGKNDNDKEEEDNSLLEQRINNVTRSLEDLEVGIEESNVLLHLDEHLQRLEADRVVLQLEMASLKDENEWLRAELSSAQESLLEASLEVTELQEERRAWVFERELQRGLAEAEGALKVAPSRIPVGSWRVEEERDLNKRALSGDVGPCHLLAPPSKIPTVAGSWRSRAGAAYQSLMEKEGKKKSMIPGIASSPSGKRGQYFKLNGGGTGGTSKIPVR